MYCSKLWSNLLAPINCKLSNHLNRLYFQLGYHDEHWIRYLDWSLRLIHYLSKESTYHLQPISLKINHSILGYPFWFLLAIVHTCTIRFRCSCCSIVFHGSQDHYRLRILAHHRNRRMEYLWRRRQMLGLIWILSMIHTYLGILGCHGC